MKLIAVEYVARRLNAIELAAESGMDACLEELHKLQHGLEFYAEVLPLTDSPRVARSRKTKRRRR